MWKEKNITNIIYYKMIIYNKHNQYKGIKLYPILPSSYQKFQDVGFEFHLQFYELSEYIPLLINESLGVPKEYFHNE